MTEIPMKFYWMGDDGPVDVDTLPREKLLEIIHHLNRDLESARNSTRSIIKIHDMARRARQSHRSWG